MLIAPFLLASAALAAAPTLGPAEPVKLGKIPPKAALIYHLDGTIRVMNSTGGAEAEITFVKRNYEHKAVSFDRRWIVANEQMPNPAADPGGRSRLWLFDLESGTERRLVPDFITAGNGGVAFDKDGWIYFAGKDKDPFPKPSDMKEHIANAAANDVWRVRVDGTGLTRLGATPEGEADVAVTRDGALVTGMSLVIDPPNDTTVVWTQPMDGGPRRVVYKGGKPKVSSAHDPEISDDKRFVVFSRPNTEVEPNFKDNPDANTAHDLFAAELATGKERRLTEPGPISIAPSIRGDEVVYHYGSDTFRYAGAAIVKLSGTDQKPRLIKPGATFTRWFP